MAVVTAVKRITAMQPVLFQLQGRLWLKVHQSAIEIQDASCFLDAV